MNGTHNSWSMKEIIKGKTLDFLVLTLIFTIILNNVADKGLTSLMNTDNQTIYTYNYSLSAFGLIFVIPAALFSIWVIKGLLKLKSIFFRSPIADKFGFSKLFNRGGVGPEKGSLIFSLLLKLIKIIWRPIGGGSNNSSKRRRLKTDAEFQARQKQKSDAEFQARQKRKEADYAIKHAGKQALYKSNTHHFDTRVNRANSKIHGANEAAKRARNL